MKQTLFFTTCFLLFSLIACKRKNTVPEKQYTTIPGFVPDSLVINYPSNKFVNDSMLVDFDNDNTPDLSIYGYIYILGVSQLEQEYFFRLNTLNPDYAILSAIQNDTLCNDTTMSGNQITSSHIYNCSSPNGTIITDTYATSSDQYLTIPAGIYNSGMLKIYDYMYNGYNGSPAFTYSKKFGNSYDGYFFIKHLTTNKIYAMRLKQKNPALYVLEDIILL